MVKLVISKDVVLERMKSQFKDGEDEAVLLEELRKVAFQMLLSPLADPNLSATLNHVFHYVKARDAVEAALASTGWSITLEDETFTFIKDKFDSFAGWNLQLADLVLIVSEAIKKATPK